MLPSSRRAPWRTLPIVSALFLVVACTETEVGSQACPALCPDQSVVVLDTTFELQVADTTLSGFPLFGVAEQLVVASVGDTLDTRAILRFDSMQTAYLPPGFTIESTTVSITRPDSARLWFVVDTAHSKVPATFRINIYDVDTTSTDSLTALLVPLMRPSRLIGGRTFAAAELLDTISIPIDTAKMRQVVTVAGRLRVGLQIVAPGADALVRFQSSETANPPRLYYKAAPDSGATLELLLPRSNTPLLFSTAQSSFQDWTEVVIGAPPLAANTSAIGGLPARRPMFTFSIPPGIIDSSEVVRAILTLTQVPRRTYRDQDTLTVFPLVSVATANVADPVRAISFAQPLYGAIRFRYPAGAWSDSLKFVPRDSGARQVEVTALVREWRINVAFLRRILTFRLADEGYNGADVRFFSSTAPSGLRPRLRILYVPGAKRVTP